jgi:hypothetical protein
MSTKAKINVPRRLGPLLSFASITWEEDFVGVEEEGGGVVVTVAIEILSDVRRQTMCRLGNAVLVRNPYSSGLLMADERLENSS